ncbi:MULTISPECIES: hypothetical protein [Bacillus]|uniref:hypothetical protein n=1 Tax=Bacillus TaxID=1386 RepID=UPI001E2D6D92|nr:MULTISPECIES: hypothetical protein [Bacillus]MCC9090734.1 hypothetical protein [Bacillus pumilus]MED1749765.1 hypothetical protein [Bacillus zhangzhouensis]UUD43411.1 hypothetical protein NPA43_03710 [Bacillus pumilus]
MKLTLSFLSFFMSIVILSSCEKEYSSDYVRWGEKIDRGNSIELLEKHNIPYKLKKGIIYIPEDAVNKAVYCCS